MNDSSFLEQMLQQQLGDNPQLQSMYQMMRQKQVERAEAEVEEEEKHNAKLERYKQQIEKAATIVNKQKEIIGHLKLQLSELENFQDELAMALGACIYCWGQEPTCRACRGKGRPGAFEPDEQLFQRWITPAMRRIKPTQDN